MKHNRYQSGVSLIEVLVSTVIIAVGILGIAGLQVVSIQQNRSALYRAEATKHATDILDRIRVNRDVDYAPVVLTDAPAATDNCGAEGISKVTCNKDSMKAFDVAYWKCSISHLDATGAIYSPCTDLGFVAGDDFLPEGQGGIVLTAAPANIYEVTVKWRDDSGGGYANITLRAQVK